MNRRRTVTNPILVVNNSMECSSSYPVLLSLLPLSSIILDLIVLPALSEGPYHDCLTVPHACVWPLLPYTVRFPSIMIRNYQ